MKKELDIMMNYLSQLTQDEANLIEHVLKWPDEYKGAFFLAKRIFERNDE